MNYRGADVLIALGGACKSLPQRGPGWFSGLGVIYSSENDPDLVGEFFTKNTRCGLQPGNVVNTFYRHGQNPKLGRKQLTVASFSEEREGIRFTGRLDLTDPFQQRIDRLIEKGKMGLSTGSMGHLTSKEQRGKAAELTSWPIGELSITPTPCEPRTMQRLIPLKSLMGLSEFDLDAWEEGEEALADQYLEQFNPKKSQEYYRQKAMQLYVETLKRGHELRMMGYSQHDDEKAEMQQYYSALAKLKSWRLRQNR